MAGITHVAWKADMEDAVQIVQLLASRNQSRIDGVVAAGGDTGQLTGLLGARVESLRQAAAAGEQIVAAADGVHIPIGRAITAAGKGWTPEDKGFNTTAS